MAAAALSRRSGLWDLERDILVLKKILQTCQILGQFLRPGLRELLSSEVGRFARLMGVRRREVSEDDIDKAIDERVNEQFSGKTEILALYSQVKEIKANLVDFMKGPTSLDLQGYLNASFYFQKQLADNADRFVPIFQAFHAFYGPEVFGWPEGVCPPLGEAFCKIAMTIHDSERRNQLLANFVSKDNIENPVTVWELASLYYRQAGVRISDFVGFLAKADIEQGDLVHLFKKVGFKDEEVGELARGLKGKILNQTGLLGVLCAFSRHEQAIQFMKGFPSEGMRFTNPEILDYFRDDADRLAFIKKHPELAAHSDQAFGLVKDSFRTSKEKSAFIFSLDFQDAPITLFVFASHFLANDEEKRSFLDKGKKQRWFSDPDAWVMLLPFYPDSTPDHGTRYALALEYIQTVNNDIESVLTALASELTSNDPGIKFTWAKNFIRDLNIQVGRQITLILSHLGNSRHWKGREIPKPELQQYVEGLRTDAHSFLWNAADAAAFLAYCPPEKETEWVAGFQAQPRIAETMTPEIALEILKALKGDDAKSAFEGYLEKIGKKIEPAKPTAIVDLSTFSAFSEEEEAARPAVVEAERAEATRLAAERDAAIRAEAEAAAVVSPDGGAPNKSAEERVIADVAAANAAAGKRNEARRVAEVYNSIARVLVAGSPASPGSGCDLELQPFHARVLTDTQRAGASFTGVG